MYNKRIKLFKKHIMLRGFNSSEETYCWMQQKRKTNPSRPKGCLANKVKCKPLYSAMLYIPTHIHIHRHTYSYHRCVEKNVSLSFSRSFIKSVSLSIVDGRQRKRFSHTYIHTYVHQLYVVQCFRMRIF